MTESVDVTDLKSVAEKRVGSSPTWGTIIMYFITNNSVALKAHNRLMGLPRTVYQNLKIFEWEEEEELPKIKKRFTPKNSPYCCIYCKTTEPSMFYSDRKTICKPCKNTQQTLKRKEKAKQKKLQALEAKLNDYQKA